MLDVLIYLEYFGQEVNARGLIWKNVAHVVIIKRTHGLGDREINNLCVLGKITCYVLAVGGIYSSGLFGVYFQTTDRADWEVWGDLDKPTGPRTCPQKWTAPRTKF